MLTVKRVYLYNLIDLLDVSVEFPNTSDMNNLSLSEQVKILKEFVYIIDLK